MSKLFHFTIIGPLLLTICMYGKSYAQVAEKSWNYGAIVLTTADTLTGQVKYNLRNSQIRIRKDNIVKAFSAVQVSSYQFFDPYLNRWRIFFSLPFSPTTSKKINTQPYFFELIYKNKPFTIISRQALMASNDLHWYLYELEQFYLLDERDKLQRVKRSKASLLRVLKKHRKAIERFMDKNKIKQIDREAFILIVHHYNSLCTTNDSK